MIAAKLIKTATKLIKPAAEQVKTAANLAWGRAAWGSIAAGRVKAPAITGHTRAKQGWNGKAQGPVAAVWPEAPRSRFIPASEMAGRHP
jgi:hypothetical protein